MHIQHIKAIVLVVSDKKGFFSCFLYIKSEYEPMLNIGPQGQTYFWREGHNLNTLGRGPLVEATYQISRLSRPCGFRQEDLFMFSLQPPMQNMQPLGLVILAQEHFF